MQSSYYIIFMVILFIIIYQQNQQKQVIVKQLLKRKKEKGNVEMLELAKRFIGKECILYTFQSQVTGVIREVTGGAVLLETKRDIQAVNLDFVVRIQEVFRKKNEAK